MVCVELDMCFLLLSLVLLVVSYFLSFFLFFILYVSTAILLFFYVFGV